MLKIGHRGAMGYAPENTLASFAKALELGADGVELDVRLCRSGELVVIHDRRVDRTTDGSGWVSEMTLEELKALRVKGGEGIPTLDEVLDFLDHRALIDIELKEEGTAEAAARLLEKRIQGGRWQAEDFLVTSFDHYELLRFHRFLPEVPFGPLVVAKPLGYGRMAQEMGAPYLLPYFEFVDRPLVEDAHARGVKVLTWTVDGEEDIARMMDLGVDGLIGNFPDRLPGR
jgi:glycerophosphoryl diester phosphodiesterase